MGNRRRNGDVSRHMARRRDKEKAAREKVRGEWIVAHPTDFDLAALDAKYKGNDAGIFTEIKATLRADIERLETAASMLVVVAAALRKEMVDLVDLGADIPAPEKQFDLPTCCKEEAIAMADERAVGKTFTEEET